MSQNDAFWQNDRKIDRYNQDEVRSYRVDRIFIENNYEQNELLNLCEKKNVFSLANEMNVRKSSPNMRECF